MSTSDPHAADSPEGARPEASAPQSTPAASRTASSSASAPDTGASQPHADRPSDPESGVVPPIPTTAPQVSREKIMGRGISWLAIWSARWILIVIAMVIVGNVVGLAWGILMPVALALIVTAVLSPLTYAFERWLRLPSAAAAALTLVTSLGVLVYSVVLMAPSVARQSTEIANDAVKGINELQQWVQDSNLFQKEQIDEFLAAAQQRLTESADVIAGGVLTGVGAVTSLVINLVVIAFLVFFFLKDGRHFMPWLQRNSGPHVGAHLGEVLTRAWNTLGGFIRTQALVSAIDAVLIGIGLVLIGVPLAVPLAVLTFFGGFIPIVGAIAAGAVAVLVALVSNGFIGALWVLVLIVAVQQIEGNLLSPILQSKSMNLHPAIVLLSVTLGSGLFGIAGAFLAVPVAAVTAVVLRYLSEQVDRTVELGVAEDAGPPPPPTPADEPSVKERLQAGWAAVRKPRIRMPVTRKGE